MIVNTQRKRSIDLAIKKMELENKKWYELEMKRHNRSGGFHYVNIPNKECLFGHLAKLDHTDPESKKEIFDRLRDVKDSEAVSELVRLLKSEKLQVRWAAMRVLANCKSTAVRPLFIALTRDFDSNILLQSTLHILRDWRDSGILNGYEYQVLYAMEHHKDNLQIARLANEALISNYRLHHFHLAR